MKYVLWALAVIPWGLLLLLKKRNAVADIYNTVKKLLEKRTAEIDTEIDKSKEREKEIKKDTSKPDLDYHNRRKP